MYQKVSPASLSIILATTSDSHCFSLSEEPTLILCGSGYHGLLSASISGKVTKTSSIRTWVTPTTVLDLHITGQAPSEYLILPGHKFMDRVYGNTIPLVTESPAAIFIKHDHTFWP